VTHVQPQISSTPCTCCNTRSVRHVADRYPPLSKTTCRSQSFFTFRINFSGVPSHPDLRCSHIMLVMVQAWSRAVQVARPSPISIETPPHWCRGGCKVTLGVTVYKLKDVRNCQKLSNICGTQGTNVCFWEFSTVVYGIDRWVGSDRQTSVEIELKVY
jgi:hypothetical protein